jgi:hypothetical protein
MQQRHVRESDHRFFQRADERVEHARLRGKVARAERGAITARPSAPACRATTRRAHALQVHRHAALADKHRYGSQCRPGLVRDRAYLLRVVRASAGVAPIEGAEEERALDATRETKRGPVKSKVRYTRQVLHVDCEVAERFREERIEVIPAYSISSLCSLPFFHGGPTNAVRTRTRAAVSPPSTMPARTANCLMRDARTRRSEMHLVGYRLGEDHLVPARGTSGGADRVRPPANKREVCMFVPVELARCQPLQLRPRAPRAPPHRSAGPCGSSLRGARPAHP